MFVRVCVLASVVIPSATNAAPTKPLTLTNKKQIAAAVRAELKDPDSAEFRWPIPKDKNIYCGWVNAKNSFGGYIGFQPFAVIGGVGVKTDAPRDFFVYGVRIGSPDEPGVQAVCAQHGFNMDGPPAQ